MVIAAILFPCNILLVISLLIFNFALHFAFTIFLLMSTNDIRFEMKIKNIFLLPRTKPKKKMFDFKKGEIKLVKYA